MPTERELNDFRAQAAAWMAANKPPAPGFLLPQTFMEVGTDQQFDFLREWQFKLWSAGYLGLAWPREYGGGGMDPAFQRVADSEMRAANVPIAYNVIGLSWAGPLLLDIGSAEEKAKYIKGILSGEDCWCQGFSEPEHGSDLGAAQCRAARDGDSYVINGAKIWTTMGHHAKYMILLARTDPAAPRKYDGLSFFLAPMNLPGIEARPIRKMTGEHGFTETFFTNARIPAACLLGGEGQGWRIAMQTLQYERGAAAGQAGGLMQVRVGIGDVLESLRGVERDGAAALADPAMRERLVRFIMEEKAIALGARRAAIPALNRDYPGALPLSAKLRGSEHQRRMRQFAVTAQGAHGALYVGDARAVSGGFWQRAYFNSFSATIGGGTSQVQANIIGERVLGLPK